MEETDLCWSATVETGVLFIGRGVAYRKTGLHGILFISTVDLLQPPRATVHPQSTSSSLHLRLFIHGLLFIQPPPLLHRLLFNQPSPWGLVQPPLHGLLFIHPSTVYCLSSPPRGRPVHPALHGVLFIQPQPARSIGVLFIQRQHHGVLFIHPHRELFIQTLPAMLTVHPEATPRGLVHPPPPGTVHPNPASDAHCSSQGSIDRLPLAAVAKESLHWVQLAAIDRSLGFSNA